MSGLVDVHAHFLPDFYRAELVAAGADRSDGSPLPPWSPQAHVARMDELGIATSLVSASSPGVGPVSDPAGLAQEVNDYGLSLSSEHSGRFGLLAVLPLPDIEASVREAARALDGGAAGLGLLSSYAGRYLGAAEFAPLWELLNARHARIVIHPTAPCGWQALSSGRPAALLEYLFDSTRTVVDLMLSGTLERYPDIRWVVLHNGAALPSLIDRVSMFAKVLLHAEKDPLEQLRGLYFEIGSSVPMPRTAAAIAELVDEEHLLFGTDTPYAPPSVVSAAVERLRSASGDVVDLDATSTNARALFPVLPPLS